MCVVTVLAVFSTSSYALAYFTEFVPDTENSGDILIGPAKIEIDINPGEAKTFNFTVQNRTGRDQNFRIEIEDFTDGEDSNQTVKLLGEEKSQWTLKDFIFVQERSFALKNGERAKIPVSFSVPADSEPGGKFASVLVSIISDNSQSGEDTSSNSKAVTISRAGVLVFATVSGSTVKSGELLNFSVSSRDKSRQVRFGVLYENNGNVHLNPYGFIEIKSIFGKTIANVEIDPWFVLPQSQRSRDVIYSGEELFGLYKAKIFLNRGYDDVVDEKEVSLTMIPPEIGLLVVLILFFGVWALMSRFKMGA